MFFSKSNLTVIGACLFICISSLADGAKKKSKKELEIITEFKPDDCSVVAEDGDTVKVHYTGTLESGAIFDSSRQEGRDPIDFKLGGKMVIQGWEMGIKGMCVGEKRKLIIPPHLGYGKKGSGPIPGDATLIFDTELMDLDKPNLSPTNQIMNVLRFVMPPAFVCLVIYYMWDKSTKVPAVKSKGEKKSKKKR